jgi:hypothetical protein
MRDASNLELSAVTKTDMKAIHQDGVLIAFEARHGKARSLLIAEPQLGHHKSIPNDARIFRQKRPLLCE